MTSNENFISSTEGVIKRKYEIGYFTHRGGSTFFSELTKVVVLFFFKN